MTHYSDDPEVQAAMDRLLAICPVHVIDGKAVIDGDCGDCARRQEAAVDHLLLLIAEVEIGLGL